MKTDFTKVIPALIGTFFSLAVVFEYLRTGNGCIGGYGKFHSYCGSSAALIVIALVLLLNMYSIRLMLGYLRKSS